VAVIKRGNWGTGQTKRWILLLKHQLVSFSLKARALICNDLIIHIAGGAIGLNWVDP
jgi:hypothetical protein